MLCWVDSVLEDSRRRKQQKKENKSAQESRADCIISMLLCIYSLWEPSAPYVD